MSHAAHIARLKARRAELTKDLNRIEDALDDPAPQDWEDRAAERQGDEVLEALGAHDAEELRRIDAALARAKSGTYGLCVACGGDIPEPRLASLPETPFCPSCAP